MLAAYRREWLRGDLLAGVAVAAYLVPRVMAYSGIAGLPPQAGLWACLGSLADMLSQPVLVGYMAGIAVTMIVGQLSAVRCTCRPSHWRSSCSPGS